jgi:hypothetical protein
MSTAQVRRCRHRGCDRRLCWPVESLTRGKDRAVRSDRRDDGGTRATPRSGAGRRRADGARSVGAGAGRQARARGRPLVRAGRPAARGLAPARAENRSGPLSASLRTRAASASARDVGGAHGRAGGAARPASRFGAHNLAPDLEQGSPWGQGLSPDLAEASRQTSMAKLAAIIATAPRSFSRSSQAPSVAS